MIQAFGTLQRSAIGALALLIGGATSASAQKTPAPVQTMVTKPMQTPVGRPMPQLRLSDTINLRPGGACYLTSDATDVEKPPEQKGPMRCVFRDVPGALTTVFVPGNKDEYITFEYSIAPNGQIKGQGREGLNHGAYSCTITGQTKPGTMHGGLLKSGALIRVWELASLP